MAENRAGLGEEKSWRMLTKGREKSKLDISLLFYLVPHRGKGAHMSPCGGRLSTKGPPHPDPAHRVERESRGRRVFPTVDEGRGYILGQLRSESRDSQSPPCLSNTEVLVQCANSQ